jgi:heme/copper-type cytochrome/quinol oxidase subunit 3
MKRRALDVSRLPSIAFAHRDPMWWAVMSLIAIEATMIGLLLISYLYVSDRTSPFPPAHFDNIVAYLAAGDALLWALSVIPQHRASNAAVRADVRGMRRNLVVASILVIWACVFQIWVFVKLPFAWDSHAYGSVVWGLYGLNFVHGLTAIIEDLLSVAILFKGPVEHKHRTDIELSSPMVYFVVISNFVIFGVVFLPILLGGGR